MEKEDLNKELKIIFVRSLFLNLSAYLISVVFIGFTLSIAIGLLMGTFGMLLNLFLLNKSVYRIVKSGGMKAGNKMFGGYIVRMIIVMMIIAVSMLISVRCMVGTVIPYFYPKLIYAGRTLFRKEEKAE
ncbi:ATP synthase subunit I [Porcipelethomonas sp.]|uniref:ATP synthase subunit I n=1 Tax=Porcipelethomonas sp. TaxID=2981675 RepID=UPI003EF530DE